MEELPSVLWSLRTTPNRSTQYTPFFMVYGDEAVMPHDLRFDAPCRCIGIVDRRRGGPLAEGESWGRRWTSSRLGSNKAVYPASDLAAVARPYVLL